MTVLAEFHCLVLVDPTGLFPQTQGRVGTVRNTSVLVLEVHTIVNVTLMVFRAPAVSAGDTLSMAGLIICNCG